MTEAQIQGTRSQLEKELAIVLRNLGYRAVERPNNIIESSTNGSGYSIFVQEDGWLLFGVRLVNQFNFNLDRVNEFNRSYRFGKLCLDRDGDLYFSADMRISPSLVADSFGDCVMLWDQLVGLLSRSLRAAQAG